MQKKEIKIKISVETNPHPSVGPDSVTLTLDEEYARRLLKNIDFVKENEVRADKSRDEIDCVDFICGAEVDYHHASTLFGASLPRFRCFPESVCLVFYDDDNPDCFETGLVTVQRLRKAMKRKGWL